MNVVTKEAIKLLLIAYVFLSSTATADVLKLKDGRVLDGQYQGGTQGTLRFLSDGNLSVVPVKDILALTFTGQSASESTPSTGTAAVKTVVTPATSAVSTGNQSIPTGTNLLVRISEEVGTHNVSAGDRFSATLESNLIAGSVVIAPAGTTAYGQVLKSKKGGIGSRKAILELTLTQIKINGQLRSITTSVLKGEGKGKSGGLGRKLLKGAAIGGLVDGSSGAESGVKVGAGIGILAGGKHAGIKNGTLIEFILHEPLSM